MAPVAVLRTQGAGIETGRPVRRCLQKSRWGKWWGLGLESRAAAFYDSDGYHCSRMVFPGGSSGEEPACQRRRCRRCRFDPWGGKIPWRRKWQPTPVFLPGKYQGQRSLMGFSPWDHKESDTTEHAHTLCNMVAQGGNGEGDLMQKEPGYLCKAGQTQYTNQWIWGAWEGLKVDVMVFDLNNLKDEIGIYWDRVGSRRSGLKKSYAMLSHEDNLLYSLLKYLVLVFTPKSLIHVELISVFSVKQGFIVNFSLVWITNFLSIFYWIISSFPPVTCSGTTGLHQISLCAWISFQALYSVHWSNITLLIIRVLKVAWYLVGLSSLPTPSPPLAGTANVLAYSRLFALHINSKSACQYPWKILLAFWLKVLIHWIYSSL